MQKIQYNYSCKEAGKARRHKPKIEFFGFDNIRTTAFVYIKKIGSYLLTLFRFRILLRYVR